MAITPGASVTLLAAVLTALAWTFFSLHYRSYRCWWSWGGRRALADILLCVALGGVAGGLAGWLLASLVGRLTPGRPGNWIEAAITGFVYGVAGSLAVRGQPEPASVTQHVTAVFGAWAEWARRRANARTEDRAKAWLSGLDVDSLLHVAADFISSVEARPATEEPTENRTKMMQKVVDTMADLRAQQTAGRPPEARMRLVNFLAVYFAGHQLAKPAPGPLAP